MKYELGTSLVELMVCLILFSLIITVLLQHFLTVKRQYVYTERAVDRQFELQMITELLRESTKKAGFTPCANINRLMSVGSGKNFLKAIVIEKNSLQFSRMHDDFSQVFSLQNTQQLFLENHQALEVGQTVIIADCVHAELHKIKSIKKFSEKNLVYLEQPLHLIYQTPFYLGLWIEEKYVVKNNAQGKKALYYQMDRSEEITPYVTALKSDIQKNNLNIQLEIKDSEPILFNNKNAITMKQKGIILLAVILMLAVLSVLVFSQMQLVLMQSKVYNRFLDKQQIWQDLETQISTLSIDKQCIVRESTPHESIQTLKNKKGCAYFWNTQKYRYLVEQLGIFPCLLILNSNKNYVSEHRRITVMLENNPPYFLQVRVAEKALSKLCEEKDIRILEEGIQSWRELSE